MDSKEMAKIIIKQSKKILELEKECKDKERAYNEEFSLRKELQDELKENSKSIKIDILEEFYRELQQIGMMPTNYSLSIEICDYAVSMNKITKLLNNKIEEILNGAIQ